MKDLIITLLGITLIISAAFNVYAASKMEYNEELSDKVIDIVAEYDEDFYMDVLMETDEYLKWKENKGE